MLTVYVSGARHLQVKLTLKKLHLRNFKKERNIVDVSEGLAKMVELINKLSPQCPPGFRSDSYKIKYLGKDVTEFQNWSSLN